MGAWVGAAGDAQGAASIAASSTGLAAVLCCAHPALSSVTVKGDVVIPPADDGLIRTRSRARAAGPERFAAVPLPEALLAACADALAEAAEAGGRAGDDDWEEEEEPEGGDDEDGVTSIRAAAEAAAAAAAAAASAAAGAPAESLPPLPGSNDFWGCDGGADASSPDDAEEADDPLASLDAAHFIAARLKAAAADPRSASSLAPHFAALTPSRRTAIAAAIAG